LAVNLIFDSKMKEFQWDYQTREELQDLKGFSNLDTPGHNPIKNLMFLKYLISYHFSMVDNNTINII
jgi:hypothetical protein